MIAPRTLTRYNAWANRLIFDAVAGLPPGEAERPRKSLFRNMVHMLNHSYVIDRIFQAHLEGRPHGYTARNTPDHPPLAELWQAQQEIDAWYIRTYDAMDPARLGESVGFTFVGGGEGAMTRAEILLHLTNHKSYHRGFVAQMFYEIPARPPTTDLPVFLRDVPQAVA